MGQGNIKQVNNKVLQSIIVIVTFLMAVYGRETLNKYFAISPNTTLENIIYFYAWWILPISLVTGLLYGFRNILKELCLDKDIVTGLIFSLVVVAPMFISSALIGKVGKDLSILDLLHKTLFAGFMEELLFRGFLFGLLFRKIGWGFIPASVLGAIVFAMGHLYQGSDTYALIGIFITTFIGSAWFAWLFIEWKENLWIPIFLHIFMNLSWTLFNVSENALGGVYVNIFRGISIALSIFVTIYYNSRKAGYKINSKNLFVNKTMVNTV